MPQNRQGKKKQHEASFASPGVEKIKEQVTGLTVSPYGPIRAANNMGMPSTFQLPPQYLPRVARINDSPLYNRIFGTLASFITHFQMPINVDPTRFTNGVGKICYLCSFMTGPCILLSSTVSGRSRYG